MKLREEDLQAILEGIKRRDRRALAKAITLVESDAAADRPLASAILQTLPKPGCTTLRLAISGPPGVGKSTFINILGQKLREKCMRVAILPIDPASLETGGSILADKTRMKELVNVPEVFIRPSSSRGVLGGISPALRDTIAIVESAGFDVIIIETVGVGQSETSAYSLADFFVMLMQPGAGDGLSAMKKGILERADFLLINKADGELRASAEQSFNLLTHMFGESSPGVFLISSLNGFGIDDFLQAILQAYEQRKAQGTLAVERLRRFGGYFSQVFSEVMARKLAEVPWIKDQCHTIMAHVNRDEGSLLIMLEKLGDEVSEVLSFRKGDARQT